MAHANVLDQSEKLVAPFWGSVILHVGAAAAILGMTWVNSVTKVQWGDPNGGGMGSVAVNTTPSIPLPNRGGPTNPVANDTESKVPEPPPQKKTQPKVKAPEPDAIPLKSRNAPKRPTRVEASQPNKFRAQQKELPNQLYTPGGQAVSSPMYNLPGGGGVGVGTNSPFGTQFGWYANLIRDQVARHWKTSDLDARMQQAPAATVTFIIQRDGSLARGSVKIAFSSGNAAVDYSTMRAVQDAAPFSALPPQFTKNQAEVELRFELRR